MTTPHAEAPRLETDRLVLRAHEAEDLGGSHRIWSNPEVTRHIGGEPSTRESSWSRILRFVGHWRLLGYGYWAVVEREGGAYVGEVGFGSFKRTIDPPLDDDPEMGWVLDPSRHGRGYATEAVRAALAWGFEHVGAASLSCIVTPDNHASLRVAAKCGFREARRTTYKGSDLVVMRRPNHSLDSDGF